MRPTVTSTGSMVCSVFRGMDGLPSGKSWPAHCNRRTEYGDFQGWSLPQAWEDAAGDHLPRRPQVAPCGYRSARLRAARLRRRRRQRPEERDDHQDAYAAGAFEREACCRALNGSPASACAPRRAGADPEPAEGGARQHGREERQLHDEQRAVSRAQKPGSAVGPCIQLLTRPVARITATRTDPTPAKWSRAATSGLRRRRGPAPPGGRRRRVADEDPEHDRADRRLDRRSARRQRHANVRRRKARTINLGPTATEPRTRPLRRSKSCFSSGVTPELLYGKARRDRLVTRNGWASYFTVYSKSSDHQQRQHANGYGPGQCEPRAGRGAADVAELDDDVDKMIEQPRRGTSTSTSATSTEWPARAPGSKYNGVQGRITGQGLVYSADIVAAAGNGRAFRHVRIVIDASATTPRVVLSPRSDG